MSFNWPNRYLVLVSVSVFTMKIMETYNAFVLYRPQIFSMYCRKITFEQRVIWMETLYNISLILNTINACTVSMKLPLA